MLIYLAINSPHVLLLVYSVYQIVDPPQVAALTAQLPLLLVFAFAAGAYLLFLVFSLLVFGKGVLLNMWGHLLLFFEAISGLFVELVFKCLSTTQGS